MSSTLKISDAPNAESGAGLLVSDLIASVNTASKPERAARAPLFIPHGQDYFWTAEWQRGEAEALEEIANGDIRRFTSGTDAVRWLLADDD
jgi:hypothetical protein